MDQPEIKPIRGSENGVYPSFSPDGQWVVFLAAGSLRKVPVNGGSSQTLCVAPQTRGVTWGEDDNIIFAPANSSLMRVPAAGGKSEPLTRLQTDKGERSHRWPFLLPGGKGVLFSIADTGAVDTDRIAVQVLASGERRILVEGGSNPQYGGGYLIFARAGTLLAAPFDPEKLRLMGTAVPVVEGVAGQTATGAMFYSTARDGTLVYLAGDYGEKDSLQWVDRKGTSRAANPNRGFFHDLRLSPDGKRLALNISTDGRTDLWVYDFARDTSTRLTFDGAHSHAWHPDGKRLAYNPISTGGRGFRLMMKPADNSAPEETVVESQAPLTPTSWSPDGRILAFNESNSDTRTDIMTVALGGDRKPQSFLKTPFDEGCAMFSPGPEPRYIAYQSNASGHFEIYVQPFPGPGGKWQVSTDGGVEPVWSANGRELLYRNSGRVMSVDVETRPSFRTSKPEVLFEGRYLLGRGAFPYWDSTPDGQQFIMLKADNDVGPAQLQVVVNWFEELKRRVPAGKK
jgi:serine/threonine-protein kinase